MKTYHNDPVIQKAIQWHLTDLAYKAPGVAYDRSFKLNNAHIQVFTDGTVRIDGISIEGW